MISLFDLRPFDEMENGLLFARSQFQHMRAIATVLSYIQVPNMMCIHVQSWLALDVRNAATILCCSIFIQV